MNPLRRIGVIELSLIFAPISAAFCKSAVADVYMDPTACREELLVPLPTELKDAGRGILGLKIGSKSVDIMEPCELRDKGFGGMLSILLS